MRYRIDDHRGREKIIFRRTKLQDMICGLHLLDLDLYQTAQKGRKMRWRISLLWPLFRWRARTTYLAFIGRNRRSCYSYRRTPSSTAEKNSQHAPELSSK